MADGIEKIGFIGCGQFLLCCKFCISFGEIRFQSCQEDVKNGRAYTNEIGEFCPIHTYPNEFRHDCRTILSHILA